MYYTNSTEFAQLFALMLGEEDQANKIQKMKEITNEDINIELYRVEADVIKSMANGVSKIKYYNKNGSVRVFTTDELYKALRRVRLDCSTIVSTLVVIHKISFDIKMHMPAKKLGAIKKDFTPPRQSWMDGAH
jgi:hypothetical protein